MPNQKLFALRELKGRLRHRNCSLTRPRARVGLWIGNRDCVSAGYERVEVDIESRRGGAYGLQNRIALENKQMRIIRECELRHGGPRPQTNQLRRIADHGIDVQSLDVDTVRPRLAGITFANVVPFHKESSHAADGLELDPGQSGWAELAGRLGRHGDERRRRSRRTPEQIARSVDRYIRSRGDTLEERHVQTSGDIQRLGGHTPRILFSQQSVKKQDLRGGLIQLPRRGDAFDL